MTTILDTIRADLKKMTHQQSIAVSEKTGVPLKTVLRLRRGDTPDPRFSTVHALSQFKRRWKIR